MASLIAFPFALVAAGSDLTTLNAYNIHAVVVVVVAATLEDVAKGLSFSQRGCTGGLEPNTFRCIGFLITT
jgi:hypothetical protein